MDACPVSWEESSGWSTASGSAEQHVQNLSVNSGNIDGIGMAGAGAVEEVVEAHRRRQRKSIDGFSKKVSSCLGKKAMPPEKLAELAKVDPKRAKRILANRKSAAKSKEKKMRYADELEKNVQELHVEANKVNARVDTLVKKTTDLAAQNKELKILIEATRKRANAKRARNQKMKEEMHSLMIEIYQYAAATGFPSYDELLQFDFSSQLPLQQFPNPTSQHLAPQPPQLSMPLPLPLPPPPPPRPFGLPFIDHCGPSFFNYNQPK